MLLRGLLRQIKYSREGLMKDEKIEHTIDRIIDYFNHRTQRHHRKTTEAFRSMIRGRLKEGYTFEQAIEVIDFKYVQWWDDPKMHECVNLITLFRPSHFDNYIHAAIEAQERFIRLDYNKYVIEMSHANSQLPKEDRQSIMNYETWLKMKKLESGK